MVRMDVTNWNTDDDSPEHHRWTDGFGPPVCAAAGTNRFLNRDTKFTTKFQSKTLETRIGYHGFVEVTEHWTFFHCGLDEVIRIEGVISRAAFEADCNVRFYNVTGNKCAAFADFFLERKPTPTTSTPRSSFFRSFMVSRTAAQPRRLWSNALPSMTSLFSSYSKVTSGTTGCTDVDVVYFSVSSLEVEPIIDYHISDGWAGIFLCSGEEVNWCAGNNTGNPSAVIGLYFYFVKLERCSWTSRPKEGTAGFRLV